MTRDILVSPRYLTGVMRYFCGCAGWGNGGRAPYIGGGQGRGRAGSGRVWGKIEALGISTDFHGPGVFDSAEAGRWGYGFGLGVYAGDESGTAPGPRPEEWSR